MSEVVNPALLIMKDPADLKNVMDPKDIIAADVNGKLVRTDYTALKNAVVSGAKKAVPATVPTPWNSGDPDLFEKYDVNTAGTYTNFKVNANGDPVIIESADLEKKIVQIWVTNGIAEKIVNPLPQATQYIAPFEGSTFPIAGPAQRTYNNAIWEVEAGINADSSDVPGVSSKWKSIGGSDKYDSALTALGDLAVTNTEQVFKSYKFSDSDQSLFGVAPQAGLLRYTNIFYPYSESGWTYRTWLNIPVSGFNQIKLKFYRIGGSSTDPEFVNVIGKKLDGSLVLLVKPNSAPASGVFESLSINVDEFASVSIYLGTQSSFTNIPEATFVKRAGQLEYNAVKKYVNAKIIDPGVIDLIDFGCVGDGVTDDTAKFTESVVKAMQTGQRIYGRSNPFMVSSIAIPGTSDWTKVEIFGDRIPVPTYGTVGSFPAYKQVQKGMRIYSNMDNNLKGVIHVNSHSGLYTHFNNIFLVLKNLVISTYDNPGISGVFAYDAVQLRMEDVLIDTGVYNVEASEPTKATAGIITPGKDNAAYNYLRNVYVSGYENGISVNEHTDGDSIAIHSCKHALRFKEAHHASFFKRVLSQRNQNVVTVEGTHLFEIDQLNMEYVGSGPTTPATAWQNTIYELNDPNNYGVGRIDWSNVEGGVGNKATWRALGGKNIIANRIGSDNKVYLTMAQYNALSTAEKNNGKEYFIES